MISIRYSIPPPLISRYTSVISEATGFNYIAIRRHIVGFNPCFLERSDNPLLVCSRYTLSFQSTLPRRERQQFQPKIHSNFQQKSTNYHFIYLIFPLFPSPLFLHSTSFVHILECESPVIFMSASYSHSYIITKSMYHLLQFRDRHPYVPPLSDTYFPDNRISGCQRSHQ